MSNLNPVVAAILAATPERLASLPESAQDLIALVRDEGVTSVAAMAGRLGRDQKSTRNRLKRLHKHMTMDPSLADRLQRSTGAADVGDVHSAWLKNKDGDSVYVYFGKDQQAEDDTLERIREMFHDIPPAPDVSPPVHAHEDLLTIYPLADAHVGMMAWGKETGEDYDTSLAVKRITDWIGRCVASSPHSSTAVILDVGDLMHADDQMNQTPRSKHVLDVDTRYYRTIEVTIAALAAAIELALQKHERVIVRILPGNHNPHSYVAILFALAERYRYQPRVEVQKVPGEFFIHQFGRNLIAAHHGDKAKAEQLVLFLADEHPEIWGATRHRYLFTGHLHHHKSADIGGVVWEQLRALTARDAYAVSHAYSARAQLQAITLHKDRGEVQRVKVGM